MRQSRWFGAKRANALIADYIKTTPGLHFIDVTTGFIDINDDVKRELFRWDGLSLNAAGRAVLADRIKPALLAAGLGERRAQ
jgi:hypothetical protein